jgi:hypothetical protein
MSRARHSAAKKTGGKCRESGGEVREGNPAVFKLAEQKTAGKIEGGGGGAKKNLGRKSGGSDTQPYSSAARKRGGKC